VTISRRVNSMKVTSQHLEELRVALLEKNASLEVAAKAATAAADQRDHLNGQVRALQGSFDIFAASFAQDSELASGQLAELPAEAQAILGYTQKAGAAAK
jgi:hypothetical protein